MFQICGNFKIATSKFPQKKDFVVVFLSASILYYLQSLWPVFTASISVVSSYFTFDNDRCCYNSLKDDPTISKRYMQKLIAIDGSDEDSPAGTSMKPKDCDPQHSQDPFNL